MAKIKLNLTVNEVDKKSIQPAKDFLSAIGISEDNPDYPQLLYNLRYAIFHAIDDDIKCKDE